jgi:hypothetical protein
MSDAPLPTSPPAASPREYRHPHHGSLVLILGILGLVLCFGFGIAAWVIANSDLAAMARGEMDESGAGMTRAGKVCGIVSVCLAALGIVIVLCAMLFAFGVATQNGH